MSSADDLARIRARLAAMNRGRESGQDQNVSSLSSSGRGHSQRGQASASSHRQQQQDNPAPSNEASQVVQSAPAPKGGVVFLDASLPRDYMDELLADEAMQETALLDDLLFVLLGIDGTFIQFRRHGFQMASGFDASIVELVQRILPTCAKFRRVADFLDGHVASSNRTYQALSAAMRIVVKEYCVVVAQMETRFNQGTLSLQKLWFYVHNLEPTIDLLDRLVHDITREGFLAPGQLLSLLHDSVSGAIGDEKSRNLYLYLTKAAAEPFMEMLTLWVQRGIIHDPYTEFMIRENPEITQHSRSQRVMDSFWQRGYTCAASNFVPNFLAPMATKILDTGKFLNVVQQCGRDIELPIAPLSYQTDMQGFRQALDSAFAQANRTVLTLLMSDYNLLERLSAVKRHFFMDHGDMFVQFLDAAEGELEKTFSTADEDAEALKAAAEKLLALLELAQRTSSAVADAFKDDLRCRMVRCTLAAELFSIMGVLKARQPTVGYDFVPTDALDLSSPESVLSDKVLGADAFALDYAVPWPVSLVLTPKAVRRYQLLFRRLFQTKNVERKLSMTWMRAHGVTPAMLQGARKLATTFLLRQRMLNFVQNIQYFMVVEVLEPNWQEFLGQMHNVQTIDDVLKSHDKFLDSSLKECMLTNPGLVKSMGKVLETCRRFADAVKNVLQSALPDVSDQGRMQILEDRAAKLQPYSTAFSSEVETFIAKLGELAVLENEHRMAALVSRLNFNGFYDTISQPLSC